MTDGSRVPDDFDEAAWSPAVRGDMMPPEATEEELAAIEEARYPGGRVVRSRRGDTILCGTYFVLGFIIANVLRGC